MNKFGKRLWAEIDLDNLIYNFRIMKNSLPAGTLACCVIKADAYGHNAIRVATELQAAGADWMAVSNIEEALEVRNAGIDLPLLVLGYTPVECVSDLCEYNISQCVYSLEYARALSDGATKCGGVINAHIKIDTGMGRIGFISDADNTVSEIVQACDLPGISPEGIFTHFAMSDCGKRGEDFTRSQITRFSRLVDEFKARGLNFKYVHSSNTAAALEYPEFSMNMARIGIALYGMLPSAEMENRPALKPVMALKTIVSHVKEVEAGTTVSYGCRFVADRKMKIATVPMGYADGFWRSNLGGGVKLLVHGKPVNIIGSICMDQLMLDVTDVENVRMGDEITVFGDADGICSCDDIALANNTINYEIVCSIGKRVPRAFIKNGQIDEIRLGLIDTIIK